MNINITNVTNAAELLKTDGKRRGQEVLVPTPLLRSVELENELGCERVFLKPENLQRTGSYKVRGAYYMMSKLGEKDRKRGVITASAGNHAQGFAFAAATLGLSGTVLMPKNAPLVKRLATAKDVKVEADFKDYDLAAQTAKKRAASPGGPIFIPAFNHESVIAGQGTVALEIFSDAGSIELDTIVVPVGGGGLLAGTVTVCQAYSKDMEIWGVQSQENSAFHDSLEAYRKSNKTNGKFPISVASKATVADGIRVGSPGDITFNAVKDIPQLRMILVSEREIRRAMVFLFEKCHLLAEGAGAAGVAALRAHKNSLPLKGKRIAIIISGGNIDINRVPQLIENALIDSDRYVRLRVDLADEPGAFRELLEPLEKEKINILDFRRVRPSGDPLSSQVEVVLETIDEAQKDRIRKELGHNYKVAEY